MTLVRPFFTNPFAQEETRLFLQGILVSFVAPLIIIFCVGATFNGRQSGWETALPIAASYPALVPMLAEFFTETILGGGNIDKMRSAVQFRTRFVTVNCIVALLVIILA